MNSMRLPVLMAVVAAGLGIPIMGYYMLWSPLSDLQQREEAIAISLQKELKENSDHLKIRKQILSRMELQNITRHIF